MDFGKNCYSGEDLLSHQLPDFVAIKNKKYLGLITYKIRKKNEIFKSNQKKNNFSFKEQ